MQLTGLSVARRAVPYLRFSDNAGAATTWGYASRPPAESSKSCLAIGPFRASYCNTGSKGGVATRFASSSGMVNVNVRVTGKRIAESRREQHAAEHAEARHRQAGRGTGGSTELVKWPTTTGSEFDTGWTTISAPASGGGETGVAFGVGGTGDTGGCYGYPMPEEWDLTVLCRLH